MSAQRATQLVEAGMWLRLSGDNAGARRLFEQALRLDPQNARAKQLLDGNESAALPVEKASVPAAPVKIEDPFRRPASLPSNPIEVDWGLATGLAPETVPAAVAPVEIPEAEVESSSASFFDDLQLESPPTPTMLFGSGPPSSVPASVAPPTASSTMVFTMSAPGTPAPAAPAQKLAWAEPQPLPSPPSLAETLGFAEVDEPVLPQPPKELSPYERAASGTVQPWSEEIAFPSIEDSFPAEGSGGADEEEVSFFPAETTEPVNPTTGWDRGSNPGLNISSIDGAGSALDLINADRAPAEAPPKPGPNEVQTLLRGAKDLLDLDDHTGAMDLINKALTIAPNDAQVLKLKERSEKTLEAMFESKLGDLNIMPRVKLKDDEIIWLNLDHRAGFVLAQIDGTVTFDDVFAVSGMSRLDTARILAQLMEEGVITNR